MSQKFCYQVKSEKIVIEKLGLSYEKFILIDNFEQMYLEIIPVLGSNIIGLSILIENQRIDFIYVPGVSSINIHICIILISKKFKNKLNT